LCPRGCLLSLRLSRDFSQGRASAPDRFLRKLVLPACGECCVRFVLAPASPGLQSGEVPEKTLAVVFPPPTKVGGSPFARIGLILALGASTPRKTHGASRKPIPARSGSIPPRLQVPTLLTPFTLPGFPSHVPRRRKWKPFPPSVTTQKPPWPHLPAPAELWPAMVRQLQWSGTGTKHAGQWLRLAGPLVRRDSARFPRPRFP